MDKIQIKAALVIELFDQFTGKRIKEGQAWIEVATDQKIIQKGNGCYVFLHPFEQNQKIIVHSQIFREFEMILAKEDQDAFYHRILWLEPQEAYPYPLRTTSLTGKIEKGKYLDQIQIYLEKERRPIRLAADYNKGDDNILLYGVSSEEQNVDYVICQNKSNSLFTIVSAGSRDGEYQLAQTMNANYKQSDAIIHKIYTATIREDGTFYVAFPEVIEDMVAYVLKGKTKQSYPIEMGKPNKVGIEAFT